MGQVEIHHRLAINAEVVLINNHLKMARVATSRGTRLPSFGYHSSRKYQRSLSGIDFGSRESPAVFGTQTRDPE